MTVINTFPSSKRAYYMTLGSYHKKVLNSFYPKATTNSSQECCFRFRANRILKIKQHQTTEIRITLRIIAVSSHRIIFWRVNMYI